MVPGELGERTNEESTAFSRGSMREPSPQDTCAINEITREKENVTED